MSEPRRITDFPDLSTEDTISLTLGNAADPNRVEFILETTPSVTWWKALELRSRSGRMTHQVETEEAQHGPRSFSVAAANLDGARLTLAKAKILGFHTGMYELSDLAAHRGRSLHFLWQRDEDRDGPVAGFFRDLGRAIAGAADAVADAVTEAANAVAEVVGEIIESIGSFLAKVLEGIGSLLGGIPGIGPFLRGAFHWLGTVVSAAFDLVATVFRAAVNLVTNVAAGLVRIVGGGLGGLLAWDGRYVVEGVGDVASGVAGAVVAVAGKLLALVQSVFFLQWGERPLNAFERALLARVFRRSVALDNVRVIEGFAGFFSLNNRPFTLGNKIYMKDVSSAADPAVLVHECCHVWQNQHEGTRYVTDALWAQATVPNAYSWTEELARGHLRWQDFNKEAQAAFIEEVCRTGRRMPPTGALAEFYDDDPVGRAVSFRSGSVDYTELARESVRHVRGVSY